MRFKQVKLADKVVNLQNKFWKERISLRNTFLEANNLPRDLIITEFWDGFLCQVDSVH